MFSGGENVCTGGRRKEIEEVVPREIFIPIFGRFNETALDSQAMAVGADLQSTRSPQEGSGLCDAKDLCDSLKPVSVLTSGMYAFFCKETALIT